MHISITKTSKKQLFPANSLFVGQLHRFYISTFFQASNDEFHCKTATNIEDASKLIEAGFDYVTTFNDVMLFRKRRK